MLKRVAVVFFFVAVSLLPGIAGGPPAPGEWYASLVKSSLTPPGWVFGPVWTLLYILMGVAAWRVWRSSGWRRAIVAHVVNGIQLVLNGLWSWIFFGLHQPGWALLDLVLLWLAVAGTMALYRKHDRAAAWLLVPYLLWISFAGYLNGAIWRLNP